MGEGNAHFGLGRYFGGALTITWYAQAQPSSLKTYFDTFRDCTFQKAEQFASLEGSITEIVEAAIGACTREKLAMQEAYGAEMADQSLSLSDRTRHSDIFVNRVVEGLTPELLAAVA